MFYSLQTRYDRGMGEPIDPARDRRYRLSPTMRSRKLQALDFIKRYFAEWQQSPTLGEIAAALSISVKRSHELVGQLVREGEIARAAGRSRGIALIDRAEELSEAEVLARLAQLGWKIAGPDRTIAAPLMDRGLNDLPLLDHKDDQDFGVGAADAGGTGPDGAG